MDNAIIFGDDSLYLLGKNDLENSIPKWSAYLPAKINDAIVTKDSSVFLSSWDEESANGGLYTLKMKRLVM